MCGRFTLNLAELTDLKLPLGLDHVEITDWSARYNIAPSQPAPVATQNGQRALRALRWGLVPHWAKDPSIGTRMINARVESVADKPAFRDAFRRRRCIVPATGYYEWQPVPGARRKQPMWIHPPSGGLLMLAGLWDRWHARDGAPLDSFTVVTMPAGPAVREVHDRMPLTLAPEGRDIWLGTAPPDDATLQTLLARSNDAPLAFHPVDPRMNRPEIDDATCIEPAHPKPTPDQLGLFD